MTHVLVVDDTAIDRALACGLLEGAGGFQVQSASSAAEALQLMTQLLPDLVLTDLVMPDMDGLQLVAESVSKYPQVPVILMTSKGSEETAVLAIRQGASSYVPKHALSTDLVDTVRTVLDASTQRVQQQRMLAGLLRNECEFVLENDRQLIPPLVAYLQESMVQMGLCDEKNRTHVGIALEEALVNALYHGNLEMSSELRETDYDAYYALANQRRAAPPFRDRKILVCSRMSRDEAVVVIRDEGPGFDPDQVADPTNPDNWEHVSGRGLFLMRTFMDEVRHNNAGNEVTMIKRRRQESSTDLHTG